MEFTAEDQYIIQALAEHLNTKYGGAYLIVGNDKQTMVTNNGFSKESVVDSLLNVIEKIQGDDEKEMASKYGVKNSDNDLLDSVKSFIDDANKNLKELDIRALKNNLEYLEGVIEDIEAEQDGVDNE